MRRGRAIPRCYRWGWAYVKDKDLTPYPPRILCFGNEKKESGDRRKRFSRHLLFECCLTKLSVKLGVAQSVPSPSHHPKTKGTDLRSVPD